MFLYKTLTFSFPRLANYINIIEEKISIEIKNIII